MQPGYTLVKQLNSDFQGFNESINFCRSIINVQAGSAGSTYVEQLV